MVIPCERWSIKNTTVKRVITQVLVNFYNDSSWNFAILVSLKWMHTRKRNHDLNILSILMKSQKHLQTETTEILTLQLCLAYIIIYASVVYINAFFPNFRNTYMMNRKKREHTRSAFMCRAICDVTRKVRMDFVM